MVSGDGSSVPRSRRERLANVWSITATVLAIISLVDLTHQLVEWAAFIHKIAEKYAEVRGWCFNRLPFRIPKEWHDYVVLGFIFFSVGNVGYYRRTGHVFLYEIVKMFGPRSPSVLEELEGTNLGMADKLAIRISFFLAGGAAVVGLIAYMSVGIIGFIILIWCIYYWVIGRSTDYLQGVFLFIILTELACGMVAAIFGTGLLLAWRWIIGTAVLFCALVGVNEIYVHWLVPLH